jgi:hypothetical protein
VATPCRPRRRQKPSPAVDNPSLLPETMSVMRHPATKPKPLDYPDETPGSRLAAEIRKRGNKLTLEQRREHINAARAMIYGSPRAARTAGTGQ